MSAATIARRRTVLRDEPAQLPLEGLAPARPPRPGLLSERPAREAAPPEGRSGGGSLDHVIAGAWRALGAQRTAACPVCGDALHADGRCGGCGSQLA